MLLKILWNVASLQPADLEDVRRALVRINLHEIARALPGIFGFVRIVEITYGEAVVFAEPNMVQR